MSPARKAFLWIFGIGLAVGILIGVIELISPESATVTLNGQDVTGTKALITSASIGGGLGLFFGLIVAGIVKLATRGYKKAA